MIAGLAWSALLGLALAPPASRITIDYPAPGTVFPPDFASPTFLWRDSANLAQAWRVEVSFSGSGTSLRMDSRGEPLAPGSTDPRAVAGTNELPRLLPEQAGTRVWKPDDAAWSEIKRRSAGRPVTVTITGFRTPDESRAVSRGSVRIHVSQDPVGAPVFYRDVPLMPSELEKGVIKPLAAAAVPLIAWRLRYVSEPQSRLIMEGLHTCANCHSFSRDGKTMGMDLDGPGNDKGLYTIVPVRPHMTIRNEDVVQWSSFRNKLGPDLRVGFMSQVSPRGDYVVTMVDRPGPAGAGPAGAGRGHFYVANFKDYRFLQVFYPTRGILAWYSRASGRLQPLPGADDPRFVHTSAFWSPDGKYLVFARAEAREPYPEGSKPAEYANDPNETPIQYDLYRIPFNDGRGGVATPLAGASRNGMSNAFPKVSPDGRWIVFVQSRNGLLMRPDSQLYILPAGGGRARKLSSNTSLMNSWHSFSPNGRWLVFSSKSRSPYTQMFLTHLDQEGRDSPPVLIENATQANRAVNIPEFLDLPPGGLLKIDTPAVESYRVYDTAFELARQGQHEAAAAEWKRALELGARDSKVYMNLGVSLAAAGKSGEAIQNYELALSMDPEDPEIRMNLGVALAGAGRIDQAVAEYRRALEKNPDYPEAHNNLGLALAGGGKLAEAIEHYRKALKINPDLAAVHNNLGAALARAGMPGEAVDHFHTFLEANPGSVEVHGNLVRALVQAGRAADAAGHFERLLRLHPNSAAVHNTLGVALAWQKKGAEAVASFRRALEIEPGLIEAHQNLGDALFNLQGHALEALGHWREVLRAAPNHVPALIQSALVMGSDPDPALRDGREAVRLAERANQITGARDPAVLDILAAGYAESGRFPEAVETARRALALAGEQRRQPLAEALKTRIALYEAGNPYRRTR